MSQNDVDRIVHYRNLAISLGAKPEDMVSEFDRTLCKNFKDDPGSWYNEYPDVWDELEKAEARIKELEATVEAMEKDRRDTQHAQDWEYR